MDRDRKTKQPVGLPYRSVLDHLRDGKKPGDWRTPPLLSSTTRFVNIGLALRTNSEFRTWETKDKRIFLDQGRGKSKRYHLICPRCEEGLTLADCLHPLQIGGYSGWSYPHPLPWREGKSKELEQYLEREYIEIWQ